MKLRLLAVTLVSAALLTACGGKQESSPAHEHGDSTQQGQGTGGHENHGGVGTPETRIKTQAIWNTMPDLPRAKQDTKINIQIQDQSGKPIEQFDIGHERKMHLIVVSKDLSYFAHIHPQEAGQGTFEVMEKFPAGGDYKLIADFIPTGSSQTTQTKWTTVSGDPKKSRTLTPDNVLTTVVEGMEVTLNFKQLMAGMESNFTFSFKDAKTQQPITNLQPYLGAVGHVVILSADAENYLHVHPLEEKATGPDAKFATQFPKKGIYKIWGQFQREGKVIVVPFVVDVP